MIRCKWVPLFLIVFTTLFVFQGCATKPSLLEVKVPTRYLTDGRNYTFAIYDNENRLITHPIEDFKHQRKVLEGTNEKITDIIVVSHGWNFTVSEAIKNYYRYMEVVDCKIADAKKSGDCENHGGRGTGNSKKLFNPYFIFVVWSSVSRPITEGFQSILPYGLDKTFSPVTQLVDTAVFHIPSGWKESIDAHHNGVGRYLPSKYLDKGYFDQKYYFEDNNEEEKAGRELPLSMVIEELVFQNEEEIEPARIHVIGHSYGAKLVSLAMLEGLERYFVSRHQIPYDYYQESEPDFESGKIHTWLTFNAAFHPNELLYVKSFNPLSTSDPKRIGKILRSIPRKGVVFSNSDYATGLLFSMGQVVLNSGQTQFVDVAINHFVSDESDLAEFPVMKSPYVRKAIIRPILGGVQLVWNVGTSFIEWALRSLFNLPFDYVYHIRENDTLGKGPVAKLFNALHFFLPIDKIWNAEVDKQGIFRSSIPGLGRSGPLNQGRGRIALGESESLLESRFGDLGVLRSFFENLSENEKDVFDPKNPIKSQDYFVKMACSTDWKVGNDFEKNDLIFSFDASKVYDTGSKFYKAIINPAGSHGDLRKAGPDNYVSCPHNDNKVEKRVGTFNFVLKFINH